MGENSSLENTSNINIPLYSLFKNVLYIGPIALSTKLTFALAIPFRVIREFKRIIPKPLLFFWFASLFICLLALANAFFDGVENKSGLTVGLRICLTLGVLFLPNIILDERKLYEQIQKILMLSAIALSAGLINGHWIFVIFGLLPFIIINTKEKWLKVISIFGIISIIYTGIGTTLTLLFTFLLSFTLNFFTRKNSVSIHLLKKLKTFIILMPIVITYYVVSLSSNYMKYDFTTLQGYIQFKLLGDRKPIWDASIIQILEQNIFLPMAGSSLEVYFDYINTWKTWHEGSHNIFLEIGRQSGIIAMILFTFLMSSVLYNSFKHLQSNKDFSLFVSFLSIYLMFGLSGQSLVYDGVGFMFWLILTQLYRSRFINESNSYQRC